ncbi:hypothetical protein KO361_00175 [Candidatus Woesearchaeota archaeon]|nr:hypothetical protein [Candidatus Woesearchaeota archaeon]
MNKKKILTIITILTIVLIINLSSAIISYYNPNSTISNGWSQGSGITHTEITDSARQPNAPDINTFVATRSNAVEISEFGFPNITEQNVVNITLWVYTATSSNAQYTFSLRQGATTRCSTFLPVDTGIGWQSCTWDNVTGDLSDMRIHLSAATRPTGGGGPTNAQVYAAYLEIDTGPEPPNITLISPNTDTTSINEPTTFSFNVIDELYTTIDNCTLYVNFTGNWEPNQTITNIDNDTTNSFNVTQNDGYYEWNVYCENEFGRGAFAENNRTIYLNMKQPSITNYELNETSIRQNRTVRFNATITDYYGVDTATITLRYPNTTQISYELNRNGNEFYYTFTNTINTGTYEVTSIWANDTREKSGQINPEISFEVQAIPPNIFNLVYPLNNTESKTLNPEMEWEQTTTPDFDNYTLEFSKNNDFNIIEQRYNTFEITTTNYSINNLDDDSTYYWRVIAYDFFGNQRITPWYKYITDNTPPSITLNTPSNDSYTNQTKNTFTFTPSDTNTITNCYLYTNTTGTWTIANQTDNVQKNQENELNATLNEGRNAWNIRCFDEAGNNAYNTQNNTLTVDLTPPKLNLVSPENEELIIGTNIIHFEFNVSDELSEIESCSLIVNGSIEQTKYDVVNNAVNEFERFLLNNYYSWSVNCKDINGWENTTDTWFFRIDSLDEDPPLVTLNYPAANDYVNTSEIIFEYYVEDASDITNCTLYINESVADISYDVETFTTNNFFVAEFTETIHTWKVQCFDEPGNEGNSTTKTFTVDLTNPEVILNTPENDSWTKESSVNFNYYVNDSNIDYCALYTNETGIMEERQTQTPNNEENNTINRNMPQGTYAWNIMCIDLSKRKSYAENNYLINIDITNPVYSNENVTPLSPSVYEPSTTYNFSIEWTDNVAIDTVLFEHNFTGTKTNITPNKAGNTYWFTTELGAGNYSYKWYANDTVNNKNNTEQKSYAVLKDESELILYLDEEQNNITINENTLVNITAQINKPSNGFIELYLNEEKINQGTHQLTNITMFEEPGEYNVTAIYEETNNYTNAEKKLVITVMDTISPNVTLISPENESETSTGTIILRYNVTDASPITYCALYINNELEENDTSITRNEEQNFLFNAEENTYAWRVECQDTYNNLGISKTRVFTAIDTTIQNVYLDKSNNTYEQGEPITINITVTDFFDDPQITNIYTGIITSNTNVPWWNTSWTKRRKITINETTGEDIIQKLAVINATNLEGLQDCTNNIRIIKHENEPVNKAFLLNSSGSDWCEILFEINQDANTINEEHYLYYNPEETNAAEQITMYESVLFNAQQSASDEGTTTNVGNIIGKNDDTFARMTVPQGGGTISSHGRAFINETFNGDIEKVEVRYRYAVPSASNLNWAMRYSVNSGTSYANAYTGITTVAKTTSPWYDVTSAYASLTWTNLNNTRLQGRMVKSGGGGTATVDLYWVEMNVTYKKQIGATNTNISEEETLIESRSNTTNINGFYTWTWNTQNITSNNYTAYAVAKQEGYENGINTTFLIITPDITPPVVTLISPENDSRQGKGIINLSYEVFDYNIDRCTLYIGIAEQEENETKTVQNGENYFELFLDYEEYTWNVKCFDKENNEAYANNNFTFIVLVPDPVLETTLYENNTIRIEWTDEPDAEYYNIYLTNNYEEGFPEEPNITSYTLNFLEENLTGINKLFYKITMISNGRESEIGGQAGINTQELKEGFNMISLPFYLNNYELENGENNGFRFNTNESCTLTLWEYDPENGGFKKTDWINNKFEPSTGNEDFTELNPQRGYFLETNKNCELKIAGNVPIQNETITLEEELNLVSWLSAKEKELPQNYEEPLIITDPEYSVTAINRFNATTQTYELTIHEFNDEEEPWGWWPAPGNEHFTKLVPMEAYYFHSNTQATWRHKP